MALGIAVCLSFVAAYFSVLGLMEIFSAAPQAVMVMAIVLETAKVIVAYWAHISWRILPYTVRSYLVLAVLVLMGITSLGIYGFLARAHITQKTEITTTYDTKISKLDAEIENRHQEIKSIDQQVAIIDSVVSKAADRGYVTKSLQLNKKYAKDRQEYINRKTEIQKEILTIDQQKIGVQSNKTQVESKIGPLKYVVNLIYGDATPEQLNSSVRWLIIILVAVFDPLAIFLLIGTGYVLRYIEQPITRKPVAIRTVEFEGEDFTYTNENENEKKVTPFVPKKAVVIKKNKGSL